MTEQIVAARRCHHYPSSLDLRSVMIGVQVVEAWAMLELDISGVGLKQEGPQFSSKVLVMKMLLLLGSDKIRR